MVWCSEVVGLVRWRRERGREETLGESEEESLIFSKQMVEKCVK